MGKRWVRDGQGTGKGQNRMGCDGELNNSLKIINKKILMQSQDAELKRSDLNQQREENYCPVLTQKID